MELKRKEYCGAQLSVLVNNTTGRRYGRDVEERGDDFLDEIGTQ